MTEMLARIIDAPGSPVASFPYHAYGLAMRSDRAVPEFAPAVPGRADVTIMQDAQLPLSATVGERRIDLSGATRSFMLGGFAAFAIEDAARITYRLDPQADAAFFSLPLIGPVMAMLLDQRGLLVLHGSAVEHDGRAALFLGDKGAGKSTTAAACVAAGMRLLTDDVLAIRCDGGGAAVIPGFPQVKLAYDAADAIALPEVSAIDTPLVGFGKHRLRLEAEFDPAPAPAAAIYLLERGERLALTPIGGVDALTAIMRFSYLPRLGETATRGGTIARHLRDCAALANRARIYRLHVPAALDRLADVAALVAETGG